MSLKEILEQIQEELTKIDKIREDVNRDMRKATRLSKQAIQVTHQERFDDAASFIKGAKTIFEALQGVIKDYPHMLYSGSVNAAYEEHAEACILLTLVQENRFPTPEEIKVPQTPYILSLGDVIGELRRRSLDLIRRGEVELAEKCLEGMELIYSELTSLDNAYVIVNGLRRKCDVARKLIEITRGDITMEVRRNALEQSISRLETSLGNKTKNKI
ncbi:MAG: haloacid dehalogenase [Candidatus Bathyarchaeota archaeon]|nr:haloacid dehalogenase [Candidatus Bathyarchaeum sp.]